MQPPNWWHINKPSQLAHWYSNSHFPSPQWCFSHWGGVTSLPKAAAGAPRHQGIFLRAHWYPRPTPWDLEPIQGMGWCWWRSSLGGLVLAVSPPCSLQLGMLPGETRVLHLVPCPAGKWAIPSSLPACKKGTSPLESGCPASSIPSTEWIHHKVLSGMSRLLSNPGICNLRCSGAVGGRWAHSPFPFDSAFS